jgi:heterodisulfide reductase subunit B
LLPALPPSGSITEIIAKPGIISLRRLERTPGIPPEGNGKGSSNIPKNLAHASDIIYKFRNEIAAKAKFRLVDKNYRVNHLRWLSILAATIPRCSPQGVGGAEYPDVWRHDRCLGRRGGGITLNAVQLLRLWIQAICREGLTGVFSIGCSKKNFDSMAPFEPTYDHHQLSGHCPMFLDLAAVLH